MSWQVTAQYWQNEDVLCDLACCRLLDPDDPEDQGSWLPDPECVVHWQPWALVLQTRMYEERVARERQRAARRR